MALPVLIGSAQVGFTGYTSRFYTLENKYARLFFGSPGSSRVGFYIGDPCNQTCSSVLYHVFCNVTSRRCECRPEYPVNIENRQCVKASSLGGHCDYDEACAFSVAHSSCQSNECRCLDGHEPDAHATKCTPARGVAILENAELTTTVSVIVALMVFTALFCLVLRLFSKARFGTSGRDRMGDAASPPPGAAVLSSVDGSLAHPPGTKGPASRRTSRNSVDYAASRRVKLHLELTVTGYDTKV
nr:uncharacterized protein LOC119172953 [Rhipicephalus microplus]